MADASTGSVPSRLPAKRYLYRGVHARHPKLAAALKGEVIPGDVNGMITPEEHNAGGFSSNSPYTSWTRNKVVARRHAKLKGPGGVILRLPVGAPLPGDEWSWEWSPDEFFEDEVLLRGRRSGARVELL